MSAIPKPRDPHVDLDSPMPRHWLGGNAVATHLANGVNLLFPAGERFFVRAVHHHKRFAKGVLAERVKGFAGQEGRHARAHEQAFRALEAQGYELHRFLEFYEWLAYGVIEKLTSEEFGLAVTAACEHFTALLAENVLKNGVLDQAHPAMRELLLWHAAEEIEHRDVAFDLLREVNPSYRLRIAGLAMATACLGGFWTAATLMLLAQEKELSRARLFAEFANVRARKKATGGVFVKGIREYLRRDFHPSQKDLDALATRYLESVGMA